MAELPRASDAVIEAVAGHPPGCRRCSRAGFGAQPNHVFFADPFHDIGIPVDHPYWIALDEAMDAIGREVRASPSLTQVDSWRLPELYDWIGVAVFDGVEQAQPG